MLQLKCHQTGCQAGRPRGSNPVNCINSHFRNGIAKSPRRQPPVEPSTPSFIETTIRRCSAALPLAALVTLAYTPLVEASELSTVPLRRAVVEDMLVQRFTDRVKSLSDQEIAALLERLLTPDAQFPQDMLLPAPRSIIPSVNQFAAQQQRSTAPVVTREDIEEEEDDTAALLEGLSETATDVITGQTAETVGGAAFSALGLSNVLNNPSIIFGSRAAKAIGMALGFSAAVTVAIAAVQKKQAKNKAAKGEPEREDSKRNNRNSGAPSLPIGQEGKDSSKGPLEWLMSLFSEKAPQEDQPRENASASRQTATPEVPRSPVSNTREPGPFTPLDQSMHSNSSQEGINGQVLWRRKEESQQENGIKDSNEVNSGGSVLWQRREPGSGITGDTTTSTTSSRSNTSNSSTTQGDLWRMSMDQLRGIPEQQQQEQGAASGRTPRVPPVSRSPEQRPAGGVNGVVKPREAPLAVHVTTVKGSRMGRGGGSVPTGRVGRGNRAGSNVLDNAEPAEFASFDRE